MTFRQIGRGLRALFRRKSADRDIADEVESYLEQSAASFAAEGSTPEEARRAAQRELGSSTFVREQVRSHGWENAISLFFSDLAYALRRLRGNPGFTVVCVITLALGIGASTAIFSLIEGVLIKPLPYPNSERLVTLTHTAPGINIKELSLAASLYFTYSEESRAFEDVSLWTTGTSTVTGSGDPEEVRDLEVTNRFLAALGVQPAMGRSFTAADDDPNNSRTVILSDGYWKSRFGADRSILGRRILIDGLAWEVIGVLPPSFQFMDRDFSLVLPVRFRREEVRLISFCCQGVARLKPGVTIQQASSDIARMLTLAPLKFAMNPGNAANMFVEARIAPNLHPLKEYVVGEAGSLLWILMGTVGIVLLIACANVANLLLVRSDSRRQELAVRAALGAGRGRIARELFLESVALSVSGGIIGVGLAYAALRVLWASKLARLPRLHEISIDPWVLAFALVTSILVGLLFGLVPVLKHARPQLSDALRGSGRSLSQSKERNRARSLLVIVQVALALILLVGSGLMIRSFQALRLVDPGFSNPEKVETLHISIPEAQVKDPERVMRMEEEIAGKLRSLGGIDAVGLVSALPTEGQSNNPVYVDGNLYREGVIPPIRRFKFISPGYLQAMGSRLVAGRDVTWEDLYGRAPKALISENIAKEISSDPRAAIGRRVRSSPGEDWREVIGVVADLRDDGVDQKAPGIIFWSMREQSENMQKPRISRGPAIVIRTSRAGTPRLLQDLQSAISSVNPGLPAADVKTLESIYRRSLARTSLTLALLAIAGGMALLLGVIGIYGVISYSVAQRTREIGIRLALGSPLPDLTRIFLRDGLILSCIGAVCGLAGALALTRWMKSLLYDVSPADPVTYAAVAVGLIAAAALASYLPARRATRVDPVIALRAE